MTKQERLHKHVQYWKTIAEHDWQTARSLWRSKRYDGCLFFCHLVCEKFLKAVVVKVTRQDAPRIHDLIRLCVLAGLKLSEDQQQFLSKINNFNIATRYPVDLKDFYKLANKEYSYPFYQFTERFIKWVKKDHL